MESDIISWMEETSRTVGGCTTKLKSKIEIIDPSGNVVKPLKQRGTYIWDYIPLNSTLKYTIKNQVGVSGSQSDRINISVIGLNTQYIREVTEYVYSLADEEERIEYGENPSILSDKVDKEIDLSRITIKLNGITITTNNDGDYEGSIPLSNTIRGPIGISISYGYSASSEAYGWNNFWENSAPGLVIALIDVALIVLGFFTGGAAWAIWSARAAEVAHTMASVAYHGAKEGRGDVGDNKYGCSLGDGHYHSYGGIVTSYEYGTKSDLRERMGLGLAAIGVAIVAIIMIPTLIGGSDDE